MTDDLNDYSQEKEKEKQFLITLSRVTYVKFREAKK